MTISFLASHNGTAARDIIMTIQKGDLRANVGVVITNNEDAAIREWCERHNVACHYISAKTHPDECLRDRAISQALEMANTDLVILSGYMKKVGDITLSLFENKMLNIHPSLLPKHGGHGLFGDKVHESVLASGDTKSGATVHIVTAEFDEGPMVDQESVEVLDSDTVMTLKARVQSVESRLFIRSIKTFMEKNATV